MKLKLKINAKVSSSSLQPARQDYQFVMFEPIEGQPAVTLSMTGEEPGWFDKFTQGKRVKITIEMED